MQHINQATNNALNELAVSIFAYTSNEYEMVAIIKSTVSACKITPMVIKL